MKCTLLGWLENFKTKASPENGMISFGTRSRDYSETE